MGNMIFNVFKIFWINIKYEYISLVNTLLQIIISNSH